MSSRRFLLFIGLVVFAAPRGSAHAQVPASAEMWRLSAVSLAGPAALETGATAAFWNPAATASAFRLQAGAQVLQTPDEVGVSGLLGGVTYRALGTLSLGILLGRVEAVDLVRTSTSPTSDLGAIPVYEQLVGISAGLRRGPLALGAIARGHNSLFDSERDNGVTVDVGMRFALRRLTLAGATHFFPLDLVSRDWTDYYGGAAYWLASPTLWGTPGRLILRYGVSARQKSGVEHGGGAGLELAERLRLDLRLVREQGYTEATWRPTVGVQFRVGRYSIAAARASGMGGLGASYRIGLDVDVLR